MLIFNDIYKLINYTAFAESAVVGMAVAGLLYLRWKQPNMERPIKVQMKFLLKKHFFSVKHHHSHPLPVDDVVPVDFAVDDRRARSVDMSCYNRHRTAILAYLRLLSQTSALHAQAVE